MRRIILIFAFVSVVFSGIAVQAQGIFSYSITTPQKSEGFSMTRMNDGNYYMYIGPGTVCFDSNGNLQWFKRYMNSGYAGGKNRKARNGNVHLMIQSVAVGPGNGDVLFLNQDSVGNCVWAKVFGTLAKEVPVDFAEDAVGNIYIAGSADGLSPGINQMLFMAINEYGDQLWQRTYATDFGPTETTAIAITAGQGFIMTGRLGNDAIILKADAGGHLTGAQALPHCQLNDVTTDTVTGTIYVCGSHRNSADTTRYDLFAGAYNSAGVPLWHRTVGSTAPSAHDSLAATCILYDYSNGDLIMGGSFDAIMNSGLGRQSLLVILAANGTLQSCLAVGGGNDDGFRDVMLNTDGSIITCGYSSLPNASHQICLETVSADGLTACQGTMHQFNVVDSLVFPAYNPEIFADTLNLDVTTFCIPPFVENYSVDDLCSSGLAYKPADTEMEVNIFPNPSTGYVSIKASDEIRHVRVFNSLGRLIVDSPTGNQASQNYSIEENGIYLVQIFTDKQTIQRKLVIAR